MAEAIPACINLHFPTTDSKANFINANGGVSEFAARWRVLDKVLDERNLHVVCIERPETPLFMDMDDYFVFFADVMTILKSDVSGKLIRDDVFSFTCSGIRYRVNRRFNGGCAAWVVQREPARADQQR